LHAGDAAPPRLYVHHNQHDALLVQSLPITAKIRVRLFVLHKADLKNIRKRPTQSNSGQNMRWQQRWTAKKRRQQSYNPNRSRPIPPKENRLMVAIRAG
jgi:hypothetical protein